MRSAPSLALALVLASCGASSAAPAAQTQTEAVVIPGPPRPWAELTRDERTAHMTREVLPRMTELFAAYDATRYDAFTCATCHGEGAREHDYAMPNPALLPLHPTGSEGQHQTVRDHPEGVRFMYSRVMPAMQALLGAPEYDASTGEGFSCYAWHPHAE
ncbi:hypothetical protein [Sandaracinus amylolyticus]|uniref:hypothetical protein n=1 Tax=Sandaracinus amylolyticus TaxID=927083 RepID=UPI001F391D2D|nr:hypothetical protein [Sandaracinus amylolyticus]UJR82259.1 Hypothetical protein I5071_43240 [Sandaracinus amylolyticus]